jgi:hypothetical protein
MKEHYFKQNGATAHAANYSFNVLDQLLEDELRSLLLWPAKFVNLNRRDFYLWRNGK